MIQSRGRTFLPLAILGLFSLFVAAPLAPAQKKADKQPIDFNATKLSATQKVNKAKKLIGNIKRIRVQIGGRLKEAQGKQDLVAVECLGEKLTGVKALLFISERARTSLRNAILKNNNTKSVSAYVTIARSEQRSRKYEAQANLCIGKDGTLTPSGGPVVVILPPNVDSADPTIPIWKEPIVVRLVDASNFY